MRVQWVERIPLYSAVGGSCLILGEFVVDVTWLFTVHRKYSARINADCNESQMDFGIKISLCFLYALQ